MNSVYLHTYINNSNYRRGHEFKRRGMVEAGDGKGSVVGNDINTVLVCEILKKTI